MYFKYCVWVAPCRTVSTIQRATNMRHMHSRDFHKMGCLLRTRLPKIHLRKESLFIGPLHTKQFIQNTESQRINAWTRCARRAGYIHIYCIWGKGASECLLSIRLCTRRVDAIFRLFTFCVLRIGAAFYVS